MRNPQHIDSFAFKKFTILHNSSVMKTSTDSVLLGAWIDFSSSRHILDIGTGSGILALMAAQQNDSAQITGIDIIPDAIKLATQNFSHSLWSNRLKAIERDFIVSPFQTKKFDLLLSNPPYFFNKTSNQVPHRTVYRHTQIDFYKYFFQSAAKALLPNGRLFLVNPYENLDFLKQTALDSLFYLHKYLLVRHTSRDDFSLALCEWSLKPYGIPSKEILTLYDKGDKTDAFKRHCQDFYR